MSYAMLCPVGTCTTTYVGCYKSVSNCLYVLPTHPVFVLPALTFCSLLTWLANANVLHRLLHPMSPFFRKSLDPHAVAAAWSEYHSKLSMSDQENLAIWTTRMWIQGYLFLWFSMSVSVFSCCAFKLLCQHSAWALSICLQWYCSQTVVYHITRSFSIIYCLASIASIDIFALPVAIHTGEHLLWHHVRQCYLDCLLILTIWAIILTMASSSICHHNLQYEASIQWSHPTSCCVNTLKHKKKEYLYLYDHSWIAMAAWLQ